MTNVRPQINAMPTKTFFVDMLVKDIPLERAVLDLVDNCIDGAKRLRPGEPPVFAGLSVALSLNAEQFEIKDNCGGFDIGTAKDYAFRFGRPAKATTTDYSIGQFGVGMKRALFKFGRYFEVHSTTRNQRWSMKVDVDDWEEDPDWHFDFDDIEDDLNNPEEECGTYILVKKLRPEVAARFTQSYFRRSLTETIRSHQRQFLAFGLAIDFEGTHLTNTDLRMRTGGHFSPAIEEVTFDEKSDKPIAVRIVVGLGESVPSQAGWYIVCNGRVVLSADRSEETGWDTVSEQKEGIPKYHNQYSRFRGVVFFNCQSSRKLPWNTTKTGLDTSSPIWLAVVPKMLDHTRTAIKFLNALDDEIEEYGRSSAPLLGALARETSSLDVEKFQGARDFSWNKNPRAPGPKMTKIQYSREQAKIQTLMRALNVTSARAVGQATFDMIYKEQGEDAE